jgi:glycosyltransferase involved in cell wall biosynthesis
MIIAPKISIVTPSFNQGEFLEECIDSILSQNYPNLEYIIMDGGSTDNSVEIIKKYEKYLTYWQSKPDGGQYAAIQDGFRRSTGEIMAWLNSDDKYHHHAFYKAAWLFSSRPEVEWLTGRRTLWNKKGELSHIFSGFMPVFSREKYLKKDYRDPSIQQESSFWRRTLWERAGSRMRPDLVYAGDLDLWLRFFRHAQLYTVDTMLGGYRKHGNQKAELHMDLYCIEAEKVIDEEIELVRKGVFTDIFPAPAPISIDHNELRRYIDRVYDSAGHPVYKISDDSDYITDMLMQEYVKYKQHSNLEELIKSLLVTVFRRLGIFKFYVQNEPKFSRVYHFFRRIFIWKDVKKDRGI